MTSAPLESLARLVADEDMQQFSCLRIEHHGVGT
jgi:hypothetical protein